MRTHWPSLPLSKGAGDSEGVGQAFCSKLQLLILKSGGCSPPQERWNLHVHLSLKQREETRREERSSLNLGLSAVGSTEKTEGGDEEEAAARASVNRKNAQNLRWEPERSLPPG